MNGANRAALLALVILGAGCPQVAPPEPTVEARDRGPAEAPAREPAPATPPDETPAPRGADAPPPVEPAEPPAPAAARLAGRYEGRRIALTVEALGGAALGGELALRGVAFAWSGSLLGEGLSGTLRAGGRALTFEARPTTEGGLELLADGERYLLQRGSAPPAPALSGSFRGTLGEAAVELELAEDAERVQGLLLVGEHRYGLHGLLLEGAVRGRARALHSGEEAGFRLEAAPEGVTLIVDLPGSEGRRAWETMFLERVAD